MQKHTSTDVSDTESEVKDFSFVNNATDAGLNATATEFSVTDSGCMCDRSKRQDNASADTAEQ